MSIMTSPLEKNVEEIGSQESNPTTKTINDVPPEVLEIIIKKLDSVEKTMVSYRLVHPSWKNIINELLERRALKGDTVNCSKLFIVDDGGWPTCPNPTIRCPSAILSHPGNPFPSRSLLVTRNTPDLRNYGTHAIVQPLDIFTTNFGYHLNTFVLGRVHLKFGALIHILRPLFNLKIFKLCKTYVEFNIQLLRDDLRSFPALPKLTTLELQSLKFDIDENQTKPKQLFFTKITDAYGSQLVSLKLKQRRNYVPLQKEHTMVNNTLFPNLQQLKVFNSTERFLGLTCVPPLKRLSIVGVFSSLQQTNGESTIHLLMRFVDKFSNTLESLDLDVYWSQIFWGSCKDAADITGGILETSTVIYPKLTEFAVPYPTCPLEAMVIKKSFLVKFPALKQFHLFHFNISRLLGADYFRNNKNKVVDFIMKFIVPENYSVASTMLKRGYVWMAGEKNGPRCIVLL